MSESNTPRIASPSFNTVRATETSIGGDYTNWGLGLGAGDWRLAAGSWPLVLGPSSREAVLRLLSFDFGLGTFDFGLYPLSCACVPQNSHRSLPACVDGPS